MKCGEGVIMRLTITVAILSLLSVGTGSYGEDGNGDAIGPTNSKASIVADDMTVRMVDVTPKDWRDYVSAISTAVLAFFTVVLAVATIIYAIITGQNVEVSRQLLDSNKELIALNKAQNDTANNQLLCTIYELNRAISVTGSIEDILGDKKLIKKSVAAYLFKVSKDLLGQSYLKKVRIRCRKNSNGAKSLRGDGRLKLGESEVIPIVLWERYLEVTPDSNRDFEFVEDVDTE